MGLVQMLERGHSWTPVRSFVEAVPPPLEHTSVGTEACRSHMCVLGEPAEVVDIDAVAVRSTSWPHLGVTLYLCLGLGEFSLRSCCKQREYSLRKDTIE